jgi:hypothetical protein
MILSEKLVTHPLILYDYTKILLTAYIIVIIMKIKRVGFKMSNKDKFRFFSREKKDTGYKGPQQTKQEIENQKRKEKFYKLVDDILDNYDNYSQLHKYMVCSLYQVMHDFNLILDQYDKDHKDECTPEAPQKPEEAIQEESKPWWKRILGSNL